MTPIQSLDDIRLVTLLKALVTFAEDLAKYSQQSPDTLLAVILYQSRYAITNSTAEDVLSQVANKYPMLFKETE